MQDNVLDEDDINDVLDEELEEFEPNVGEHGSDDDIDCDYMIVIDNSVNDADMANPFNMKSKPDDIDEELD